MQTLVSKRTECPQNVPNYIHIIGVGVDCGAPCNNGEASNGGERPTGFSRPDSEISGENGDASIPNIPGREITAMYIHDTSKKCMILTSGVKGVYAWD